MKVKEFISKSKKKIFAITTAVSLSIPMALATFAAEGDSDPVGDMTTAVQGALSGFSVTNLAKVIVAGLAIAVPLVLAWFAFRWVYKKAKGGLKKGG